MNIFQRTDWASDEGWNGKLEGQNAATGISFLFNEVKESGKGPPLHKHPYDEVYLVRQGQARVTAGDEEAIVNEGDILVIPANTPHKVLTSGEGPIEIISVHVSNKFMMEILK